GTEQNRDDLQTAGCEEHDNHQQSQQARGIPFRSKKLLENSSDADFLKSPDDPAREKYQRHGQRQIEIGVGSAEKRLIDGETVRGLVSPPDRAHAGNEADPIGRKK